MSGSSPFAVLNPMVIGMAAWTARQASRKDTDASFDEVHFGGFAAKYIRQKFFMDVHPPLAKMLITLAAYIGGFDGNFDFKDIGK